LSADRRLVFFGGKGGVGKTTMAAATALLYAARGERALLVSTDPAHSTGDVMGVRLGSEPRGVTDRLDAVEIDAEAAAAAHVQDVKAQVASTVEPDLLPAVHRHLDLALLSPGTIEAALFDRLAALIEQGLSGYDRVVCDTAPTGHTLRLLALPALLTAWVAGLTRQRERVAGMERMLRNLAGSGGEPAADPLLARLHDRRERFRRAGERLRGDAVFWLVLVPERLPIEETVRAEGALRDAGVHVGGLVVNRLLPAHADGDYVAARRGQQAVYLDEIAARFPGRTLVHVDQLPTDVTSRDHLRAVGDELAPTFAPSDIAFRQAKDRARPGGGRRSARKTDM
jgi:arsenite/tail-anchored protein-transporting ATPase